ncbi:MAG: hypothetical protein H8E41_07720 [Desulfobulbaceae bacterium]|uniref:DUF4412 domain-containing protein n=1 Tax=Candidatus Desulfobia pelagia TaxID=2841692 RepID=A0A8J6TFS1_9BACT|nr:hypothetical protein [Candidatus Desulfobia pelagia]
MKNIFLKHIPLILLFSFLVTPVHGANTPWEIKLPFKQATISYTIQGSGQGTETLYIKDYGKQQARYHQTSMSIMGITSKTNTVEITNPEWVYTFDLEEQTGTKITNPAQIYKSEYNKLSRAEKKNVDKNALELGPSMMEGMGGETRKKASTILGYDCDVTSMMNMTTIHVIHGTDVLLRSEMSIMGMKSSTEATKIDTGARIDDTLFLPPNGIVAVHDQQAEAMMQQMIQNMMEQLKHPDGAERIRNNPQMMNEGGMQGGGIPPGDQPPAGQNNQEMMDSMKQGLDALKGLFGN